MFAAFILMSLSVGGVPAAAASAADPEVQPAVAATGPFAPTLPSAGGVLSENIRYVPFSDIKELLRPGDGSRPLLIPRATYEALKTAKQEYLARRPGSPLPLPPVPVFVSSVHYRGVVGSHAMKVDAAFEVTCTFDRWVEVPLPGGDVGLEAVTVDGAAVGAVVRPFSGFGDDEAPTWIWQQKAGARRSRGAGRAAPWRIRQPVERDYLLVMRSPGTHRVTVRFSVPLPADPDQRKVEFAIPRVPYSTFEFDLADAALVGEVDRAEGTVTRWSPGRSLVLGRIGPTDRLVLRWANRAADEGGSEATGGWSRRVPHPGSPEDGATSGVGVGVDDEAGNRASAGGWSGDESGSAVSPVARRAPVPVVAAPPPVIHVESNTLFTIGEGLVRSDTQTTLAIYRSPVASCQFLLPSGADLLDLRGEHYQRHQAVAATGGTLVTVHFEAAVKGTSRLQFSTAMKMADTSDRIALPVPAFQQVAEDRGHLAVEAITAIEVEPRLGADIDDLWITGVDAAELPEAVRRQASAMILLAWRYARPPGPGALGLDITRHPEVDTPPIAGDRVDAATVYSETQAVTHELNLMLKNRSALFLPLTLPAGHRLESVEVEGAPLARAQAGPSSAAFLIPIGDATRQAGRGRPFRVRVITTESGPPLGMRSDIDFTLPWFDLPVTALRWEVFHPATHRLLAAPGNLDPWPADRGLMLVDLAVAFGEDLLAGRNQGWLLLLLAAWLLWRGFCHVHQRAQRVATGGGRIVVGLLTLLIVIAVLVLLSDGLFLGQRSSKADFGSLDDERQVRDAYVSTPPQAPAGVRHYEFQGEDDRRKRGDRRESGRLAKGALMSDGPVALRETGVSRRHPGGNGALSPIVGDGFAGYEAGAPSAAGGSSSGGAPSGARPTGIASEDKSSNSESGVVTGAAVRDRGARTVSRRIERAGRRTVFERHLVPAGAAPHCGGRLVLAWIAVMSSLGFAALGMSFGVALSLAAAWRRPVLAGMLLAASCLLTMIQDRILPGSGVAHLGGLALILGIVAVRGLLRTGLRVWRGAPVATAVLAVLVVAGGAVPSRAADGPVAPRETELSRRHPWVQRSDAAPSSSGVGAVGFDPRVERVIDVVVPYSQLGERLPKDADLVMVDERTWDYLRDTGVPKPDPAHWVPPYGVTVVGAELEGEVVGDRVELTGVFHLELLGKGFKVFPLPTARTGITSVTVDGASAPLMMVDPDSLASTGSADRPIDRQEMVQSASGRRFSQGADVANQAMVSPPMQNVVPPDRWLSGEQPCLVTDRTGRVTVVVRFEKDLDGRNDINVKHEGFSLPLPALTMARLRLRIPRPDLEVVVSPTVGTEQRHEPGSTVVSAILQPSGSLEVRWRPRGAGAGGADDATIRVGQAPGVGSGERPDREPAVAATASASPSAPQPLAPGVPPPAKVFAEIGVRATLSDGRVIRQIRLDLDVQQGEIDRWQLPLPAGAVVREVTGSDLLDYASEVASGVESLTVRLKARRFGRLSFVALVDEALPAVEGDFELAVPCRLAVGPTGGVEALRGFLGISAGRMLTEPLASEQLTEIDAAELPVSLRGWSETDLVAVYRFISEPRIRVRVRRQRVAANTTAQIDRVDVRSFVSGTHRVMTRFRLQVSNNNHQFLKMAGWASHSSVLDCTVDGEPRKVARAPDGAWLVPLKRSEFLPEQGFQPFVIMLTVDGPPVAADGWRRQWLCALPRFSIGVSAASWQFDLPATLALIRGPIGFRREPGPTQRFELAPPVDRGVAWGAKTQAVVSNVAGARLAAHGGTLPVGFAMPPVTNPQVFSCGAINVGDGSLTAPLPLDLRVMEQDVLRPALTGYSLVIAILTALAFGCLAGWRVRPLTFLLVLALAPITFVRWLTPLLPGTWAIEPVLLEASIIGWWLGFLLFIAYRVLAASASVPPAPAGSGSDLGTGPADPVIEPASASSPAGSAIDG